MPEPSRHLRPLKDGWTVPVAVVLLALHFVMAVGSKLNESTTSDELVHLTAGLSYWQNHDYRLHPENGILPQRWAAIPAWIRGTAFPPLEENEYWRKSDAWVVGHQVFYESSDDHFPRLMAARAMIALFSVATGALVFAWSRKLFGNTGALVSLTFYSFSPTALAHGALATSDMCMAFFFLAACGAWWRHLHDPRLRMWALSAIALGLAFVAKYSAVLLAPMMVTMAVVRAFSPAPLALAGRHFVSAAGKIGAAAVSALAQAIVVAAVIWIFYGMRYAAFNPALPSADGFILSWDGINSRIGAWATLIDTLANWRVLPEAFLYGFAYVVDTAAVRSAFLNGEYSLTGWPTFFPWAFALKTTLGLLLAILAVCAIACKRWRLGRLRQDLYRLTPLLALFSLYWASSITSHLNIGHRHLLPIYPVLFIAAGALASWLTSRRPLLAGIAALAIASHLAASIRIAPHYLAFFNTAAGGPRNGWRHLVDSSLDWGQDLPGLKAWLNANAGTETTYLSYFGTGQPAYYRIDAKRLPFLNSFKFPPAYTGLGAGIYCISATMLQHVYSPFRGEWTAEHEAEYQKLRALEPQFSVYQDRFTPGEGMDRPTYIGRWQQLVERHDLLRFARLCHYLRARAPDDHVGYSILIYRLSESEVTRATAGSLTDLAGLVESAIPPKK